MDDADWIVCEVKEGHFRGFGGIANLGEILDVFSPGRSSRECSVAHQWPQSAALLFPLSSWSHSRETLFIESEPSHCGGGPGTY